MAWKGGPPKSLYDQRDERKGGGGSGSGRGRGRGGGGGGNSGGGGGDGGSHSTYGSDRGSYSGQGSEGGSYSGQGSKRGSYRSRGSKIGSDGGSSGSGAYGRGGRYGKGGGSSASSFSSLGRELDESVQIQDKRSEPDTPLVVPVGSSKSTMHPFRPGYGSVGKRVMVRGNHFLVKVEDKSIFQYAVSTEPPFKQSAMFLLSFIFVFFPSSLLLHQRGLKLLIYPR